MMQSQLRRNLKRCDRRIVLELGNGCRIEQVFLSNLQEFVDLLLCLAFQVINRLLIDDRNSDLVCAAKSIKVGDLPFELFRIHSANGVDHVNTAPEGVETIPVSDRDAYTEAVLVGKFGKGWGKSDRFKAKAGESKIIQSGG